MLAISHGDGGFGLLDLVMGFRNSGYSISNSYSLQKGMNKKLHLIRFESKTHTEAVLNFEDFVLCQTSLRLPIYYIALLPFL